MGFDAAATIDPMASIEISPYRTDWPNEFARIGGALRRGLGERALAIHHVGSTSVPDLAAKDVIDVQVSLDSLELDQDIRTAFAEAGFPVRTAGPSRDHLPLGAGDLPEDWAKAMAGQRSGERRVHVHIRVAGRPNQRYPLLFRDYLRADPAAKGDLCPHQDRVGRSPRRRRRRLLRDQGPSVRSDHRSCRALGTARTLACPAITRVSLRATN
jgi:GrpB-like predicted nucleotidyltransferase (UPF0157 family)